jgi:hypothetical protein
MSKYSPQYSPAGQTAFRKNKRHQRYDINKDLAKKKWRSLIKRIVYFSNNPEGLKISEHERFMDNLYSEKRNLDAIIEQSWNS